MKGLLFAFTFMAAIAAGAVLIIGFIFSESAPQEAAAAGLAIAIVAIPYCGARSIQLISDSNAAKAQSVATLVELQEIKEVLKQQSTASSAVAERSIPPSHQERRKAQPGAQLHPMVSQYIKDHQDT